MEASKTVYQAECCRSGEIKVAYRQLGTVDFVLVLRLNGEEVQASIWGQARSLYPWDMSNTNDGTLCPRKKACTTFLIRSGSFSRGSSSRSTSTSNRARPGLLILPPRICRSQHAFSGSTRLHKCGSWAVATDGKKGRFGWQTLSFGNSNESLSFNYLLPIATDSRRPNNILIRY